MKYENIIRLVSRRSWFPRLLAMSALWLCALGFAGPITSLQAQKVVDPQAPQYTRPSWWFGAAGGGNLNFYNGSTQQLTADLKAPVAFHTGLGLGLYAAPLVEFHRPTSNWGFMFQAGYDSRRGTYNREFSPCNCPRDLTTKIAYITAEPSLRFAPFKSDFYVFGGPRVSYNLKKQFIYKQGTNPAYPDQVAEPDVKGDLSNMKPLLISAQVGMGYDIPLSSTEHKTQWVISPFVAFQPYFGQSPRTIETWNITTVRAGVAVKLGCGRLIPAVAVASPILTPDKPMIEDPAIVFTVNAPKNIPTTRNVKEVFPLRNYVLFNLGSAEIPDRYVLLRKDQVQNFEEKQVQLFTPKNLAGRSDRQMVVYYNVLNILGDRMRNNPSTRITLVGSSEQGPADGLAMATSIQNYLMDVFRIDSSRIKLEGRTRPEIPSQQGGSRELELLREGDRRVTIESGSPILLMEFTNGPAAPLKPVEIMAIQKAPVDSYVTFDAKGARALSSWSLNVIDEKGVIQKFGPYTQEKISIPGKSILQTRPEGDYTIEMIGMAKSGNTIKKYTYAHLVLWQPSATQEVMRFSVLYEFDESQTIALYEKYLKDVVVPKIPVNGTVIIHGYTDIIGDVNHNEELSLARAKDVQGILENGLQNAGRRDVKFEVHGFGEDPELSQFENTFPEERFYNRSVVIDVLPAD